MRNDHPTSLRRKFGWRGGLTAGMGIAFLLSVSQPASAVFVTGNDLFDWCEVKNTDLNDMRCAGFLAGVFDAAEEAKSVCADNGMTLRQIRDVVLPYLRTHPEIRHYSASSLALSAMQGAFPCHN